MPECPSSAENLAFTGPCAHMRRSLGWAGPFAGPSACPPPCWRDTQAAEEDSRGKAAAGHFRHALAHGRLGWLGRLHRTKVVVRVRALLLLAGIREQLVVSRIPKPFRGVAMAFMCGGLLALAFMGFNGMKI